MGKKGTLMCSRGVASISLSGTRGLPDDMRDFWSSNIDQPERFVPV
jgi:hypothetical protein